MKLVAYILTRKVFTQGTSLIETLPVRGGTLSDETHMRWTPNLMVQSQTSLFGQPDGKGRIPNTGSHTPEPVEFQRCQEQQPWTASALEERNILWLSASSHHRLSISQKPFHESRRIAEQLMGILSVRVAWDAKQIIMSIMSSSHTLVVS